MKTCPEENTSEKYHKVQSLSLLAVFCGHLHQRLDLFLHLLCCGGFPVLSLPYSLFSATCLFLSVSSTVSLSLQSVFVCTSFAFNVVGSIFSFSVYSVSFCPSLSPSLSSLISRDLCPCFTPFPLLGLFFFFLSLSSCLFLCPWV